MIHDANASHQGGWWLMPTATLGQASTRTAADLFAEDCTYQVTPFVERCAASKPFLDTDARNSEDEEDIQFG